MFPMLTKPFPAQQLAARERLDIDRDGARGGALDGELVTRERLPRAREALAEPVVAQQAIQRTCPGSRIERRNQQSGFARVYELGISTGRLRNDGDTERHRFQQRLR